MTGDVVGRFMGGGWTGLRRGGEETRTVSLPFSFSPFFCLLNVFFFFFRPWPSCFFMSGRRFSSSRFHSFPPSPLCVSSAGRLRLSLSVRDFVGGSVCLFRLSWEESITIEDRGGQTDQGTGASLTARRDFARPKTGSRCRIPGISSGRCVYSTLTFFHHPMEVRRPAG